MAQQRDVREALQAAVHEAGVASLPAARISGKK